MGIHDLLYYVYVLFFGVYVSLRIACGAFALRHWRLFAASAPVLLALQGVCLQWKGVEQVWAFYPLIAHLPLLLLLILPGRASLSRAVIAVAIAYALCQLLRWIGLFISLLPLPPAVSPALHLALCQLLLMLVDRYALDAIHDVLGKDARIRLHLGTLPVLYYLYDYFMLYTHSRYAETGIVRELIPTSTVLLFLLLSVAYQRTLYRSSQAQRQIEALEGKLQHACQEIGALRAIEEKTSIYRHDLRHHLSMIGSLIAAGNPEQAMAYIRQTQSEIDALAPVRYCANETVNLLLGAFVHSAQAQGVAVSVRVSLPEALPLPDTELCALLSNGLENACRAAAALPEGRTIDIFGDIRQRNLLLEIRNPYVGEVILQDGLPDAGNGHYGCRSIQSIAQRRGGLCTFQAEGGVFVLRIAIPLPAGSAPPSA